MSSTTVRSEPIGHVVRGISIGDTHNYPLETVCIPAHYENLLGELLLPGGLIADRVEKLAKEIYKFYKDNDELHLLILLKGANRFYTELSAQLRKIERVVPEGLKRPVYLEDYLEAKSYENTYSTGVVRLNKTHDELVNICKGRHLLVVEDLVDTGKTLETVKDACLKAGAESVRVVCLFSKRVKEWSGFTPDFVGFDLPAKFIVGFGMDYNEHFRDLESLCTLNARGRALFERNEQ